MGQSQKKIHLTPQPAPSQRSELAPSTSIASIEQLSAILLSDSRFEDYSISLVDGGDLALTKDEVTVLFFSPQHWVSPNFTETLPDNLDHTAIVCCGSESDFSDFSHDHDHLHQLLLPSTLLSIDFQIRGLIRSKTYFERASEEKRSADNILRNVKHVLSISRELNGFRDVNRLLTLILQKAREVTNADAGSIYVVEPNGESETITFKISQNESIKLNLGEFKMKITDKSIVGHSVIHMKTINIPDLYKLDVDPSKNPYRAQHDTSIDKRNNYECHSMLSIPMFDISHQVIGVIQLINRKQGSAPLRSPEDFRTRVIPFDDTDIEYGEIVAHQAGIALENAFLTEEKEALFKGFVDASVKAIEQRDPTTSGHSHRVAKLCVHMAEVINKVETGIYKDLYFNENQLKEIEYASLLHDFGKLGVREQVLLKAKKLYPWEMDLLLERFELIKARYEIDYLQELVTFLQSPQMAFSGVTTESIADKYNSHKHQLHQFLEFILKANEPTVLEQGGFEKLKDIANLTFCDSQCQDRPFLQAKELRALSVSRGSLTAEEFAEIQSHVTHTYEFLRKIPWGKNLANIPQIAAKHHEKLDGTGYPTAAVASEIPTQSRIMAISDIFDALTASDRPYKKAVPVDKALDIIYMEVKAGKCDPDLFRLFVDSQSFKILES